MPNNRNNRLIAAEGGGKNKSRFLGNYYGRHDGYDGAVFDPQYICKTITHSIGGVACIIVESNKYSNENKNLCRDTAKD